MTITTATYDEPVVWAPLLIDWAEQKAADYSCCANDLRRDGCPNNAADHDAVAAEYRAISFRACQRLLVASDNKLAEVNGLTAQINDEPPRPLVDLTAWLCGKVGHWLPWVTSETWQTIGMLLMRGRP